MVALFAERLCPRFSQPYARYTQCKTAHKHSFLVQKHTYDRKERSLSSLQCARNVTFHLLLFLFRIQRLLFAQGWLPQSPSPSGPPNHGDRGDYEDRSHRRSRARREWSGAPLLPPLGGPSPLTGRTPLHSLQCLQSTVYTDKTGNLTASSSMAY